jgi:hypothetical protein
MKRWKDQPTPMKAEQANNGLYPTADDNDDMFGLTYPLIRFTTASSEVNVRSVLKPHP